MQLKLLSIHTELDRIEAIWKQLTASGAPSYFLSWGWMETWVKGLPKDVKLDLAVFEENGEPIMAAFLGHSKVTRRKIFRSTAYLLNETGHRKYDQVYVECNSFLTRHNAPIRLDEVTKLLPGKWDELCLSGLDMERFPGTALEQNVSGCTMNVLNRMPSPYVDLEAVLAKKGDYAAVLGSNTRSQLRRTYKLYRERGAVESQMASDLETARSFYEEMKDLHEKSWREKGESGAFSNVWFDEFHKRLIENRFAAGEIQLVKTTCNGETIGILYNFILDGRVYYYQAGFKYEADNRLKPGYVCHAEAIAHSVKAGCKRYEFLGGYEEFKLRLSTHKAVLVWARLQKPRLKFAVENQARKAALWAQEKYETRGGKPSRRRIAAEALSEQGSSA